MLSPYIVLIEPIKNIKLKLGKGKNMGGHLMHFENDVQDNIGRIEFV